MKLFYLLIDSVDDLLVPTDLMWIGMSKKKPKMGKKPRKFNIMKISTLERCLFTSLVTFDYFFVRVTKLIF